MDFEEQIDIGQILRLILMQSKMVLFIIFLGSSIGIANYITSDRIYKVTSLIQAFSPQSSSIPSDILDLYDNSGNEISDYENLYKSRTNLLNVITENNINLEFDGILRSNADEIIKKFIYNGNETGTFYLDLKNNSYRLLDNDKKLIFEKSYGVFDGRIFKLNIEAPEEEFTDPIKIRYIPPNKLFSSFRSKISINSFSSSRYTSKKSGLLEISYKTTDPIQGEKILNYANDLFIFNSVKSESEEASKALSFIEKNIQTIKTQLDLDKENLKNFQKENKSVNVDLEIRSIIDNVYAIESKISQIDVELAKAANTLTQNNPIFIELVQQKEELEKQKQLIEVKIKNLPVAQQEYIDLFNKVEMNQEVYSMLLDREIEFSIREASTLGNLRVIDSAYTESRVSPRIVSVFMFFISSIIISIIFAIVRGFYFLPLSNPAEIADRGIDIDISGVIPKSIEDEENEERFLQSIQSLIVNINNKIELSDNDVGAKKILITSPTPSNGKSYISRNLAEKLSELGKRVLLLDGDWKRGDLHKNLSKEKISLKEFNLINADNIEKYQVGKFFYFIPKVRGVSNSFQYLYSSTFADKMLELNNSFDYIIIDTAPLLSVSDTAILMGQADLRFCVARHNLTKVNEIKQLLTICNQLGTNFTGLIYNSYERPSSYYGYYGLYGNYAYQYYAKKYLYDSYDYGKED